MADGFNPYSTGFGLAGLGVSIFGDVSAMGASKDIANISQQEAFVGSQMNAVREQAMSMSAHRQELQQVRNMQKARSQALSTAQSQGAQFSSGLAGAYGSISGAGNSNIAGISSGLQFGQQEFGLEAQLSGLKQQMASAQSNLATDQGIAAMGSGIMSAGKLFG